MCKVWWCVNNTIVKYVALTVLFSVISACGGGGGGSSEPPTQTPPTNNPPTANADNAFETQASTSRFLTQSTFGPRLNEIQNLTGSSASDWFVQETQKPASKLQPILAEYQQLIDDTDFNPVNIGAPTFGFWRNSIGAEDQLRQRMAFALSEILVVSSGNGGVLTSVPEAIVYYQDLLIEHAFGNYRDLLEDVTYSPAMGYYLTFMGNQKGDPETGRMPDENYAREFLQLFTIGVVELNLDGSVKTDTQGEALETYDNDDITGLARVFTGLNLNRTLFDDNPDQRWAIPMLISESSHSDLEKAFLGTTIPENTDTETSLDLALDHIFNHDNVAPFIGRQLIQRLVTSNPSADYIERVATAFETGNYVLPDGQSVGDFRRGDLSATLAAVLFDDEARDAASSAQNSFGKIREPIVRFTHWARAFDVSELTPEYVELLWDTSGSNGLAQHPYRSPSVFNFFRPGYVPPGSESGAQGLTVPEMQIVNASSIPGYINYMSYFVFDLQSQVDISRLQDRFDNAGANLDANNALSSFRPDYSFEISLADDAAELVSHLNLLLTFNSLSMETEELIVEAVETIPNGSTELAELRVTRAIIMILTSPDYLVQR